MSGWRFVSLNPYDKYGLFSSQQVLLMPILCMRNCLRN